ncbi:unnamed protein product [Rodentolepis nana]|uniref:PH domain-containing protein n=1 Tax=Rodentolepis nana TaxID=102285 RepID=A0A158QI20_RODNA|nr:unnamed protein product [Rodentolepis nana]
MESDSVLSLPSGWLYKWTNYLKGYRKRCHPKAVSHTCMGTIDLTNIAISSKGSGNSFILHEARGRSYHLRALNEQDKRRWMNVLTAAKSKLIKSHNGLESDSCSDDMNSYVRSRNSGKVSQNNNSSTSATSSWRSFSRFRRKNRSTLAVSSTTEESTSPDVIVSRHSGKRKSDPISPMQSPLANGSRTSEISSVKSPLPFTYSPQRRRVLNSGLANEICVTREFQDQLNSADSAFDSFITHANHVVESIRDVTASATDKSKSNTGVIVGKLVNLRSTIDELVEACQKTMTAWTTSTEWFQRQLASEYDKSARLERTVEQLAKQHRALETQFCSSYASLSSGTNRPTSPMPSISAMTSTSLQLQDPTRLYIMSRFDRSNFSSKLKSHAHTSNCPSHMMYTGFIKCMAIIDLRLSSGIRSFSSMDDIFFDAESSLSNFPSRAGLSGSGARGSDDTMLIHPSFASLGSLRNVDESSGSEADDLVTAAADEGIFAVPCGNQSYLSSPSPGQSPSPTNTTRLNGHGRRGLRSEDSSDRIESMNDSTTTSSSSSLRESGLMIPASRRQRRISIPPRPRISLNLWGVLKNCIGKELSRIPLPVNFNEPLSFLQRVTEDLTYSKCLDEASQVSDPVTRMAWIAAFSVSSYATTAVRMSKPFNPLLGETYECDRSDDFGWRSFAEQVSHHPPVVAHYCESIRHGWKFWQEFTVDSKFRGKYLSLVPKGGTHLVFKDGQHFTWSKVTITVHNIIVGRLWAEIHGETTIKNHNTNHTCRMRYLAHSYFSRDPDRMTDTFLRLVFSFLLFVKVTGSIFDPSDTLVYKLTGTWDSEVKGGRVDPEGNPTEPPKVLLIVEPPSANSDSMYNFNKFAIELNEPEDGVAPTDSRLRPDQRLMELGQWDEANTEKERLEVKQRRKRRAWDLFEAGEEPLDPELGPPYKPVWFSPIHDTYTDEDCHKFNGDYWTMKAKQDWSRCPDIF